MSEHELSPVTDDVLPPPPPKPSKEEIDEPAQMSEVGTVFGIFTEPGRVFEDLRRKPRFILALLIAMVCFCAFNFAFLSKVGFDRIQRERIENSSFTRDMDKEQKDKIIQAQSGGFARGIAYAAPPIIVLIVTFLGGLLYWAASAAFGGQGSFLRGVAVWAYSSLPPVILFAVANLIVLMFKSADEIDISSAQNGLIKAGPGMFMDHKAMPVLTALVSTIDLFQIIGWFLAALGLKKVMKLSGGSAWTVVIIFALIGVAARVVGAMFQ